MKPKHRSAKDARSTTEYDIVFGRRLRTRRTELGLSQQALAELLGITFQQIQKYEKGANRISASRLIDVAAALETPVSFFFDGLEKFPPSTTAKAVLEAELDPEPKAPIKKKAAKKTAKKKRASSLKRKKK